MNKKAYLCIVIFIHKQSLRSRSSREIVTAFLFDCFTWNNIKTRLIH